MARAIIPVRDAAWVRGKLGDELEALVRKEVRGLPRLVVRRQVRGFLIESGENSERHLKAVQAACKRVEDHIASSFPFLWDTFGPVWGGAPRSIFQGAAA